MELLYKLFKFGIVGTSGVVVDFSLTYLFKEKVRIHKYLANAIGFLTATANNFYWNKVWTFEDTNPEVGRQFFYFLIIAMIGLAINTFFLIIFERRFRLNFYFAKALSLTIIIAWNFSMNYYFTFLKG